MKRQEFSAEELALLRRALLGTWDIIAGDCLDAVAFDQGLAGRNARERVTMTRDEVVDVVLDQLECQATAGFMHEAQRKAWPALQKKLRETDMDQLEGLAKEVFTFEKYGY
jgi:hypothetical protein